MSISRLNLIFCPSMGSAPGSAAGAKKCAQNNDQAQISTIFK